MHELASSGRKNEITSLIADGVDLNLQDKRGQTALHLASKNGHVETVILLLENGANVNLKDYAGWTPLHFAAAYCNNEKVVTLLLENGADVNAKNMGGWTPLRYAYVKNFTNVMEVLKSYGGKKILDRSGCATFLVISLIVMISIICYVLN